MKQKSFFTLICGCLVCIATMTVQAQNDAAALNDRDPKVRKFALEQTNNQSTISQAALNDRDPEIRKLALRKSTNQSTISHVALNDRDQEIRKLALKMSTNQSTISHIALNDRDPEIRKLALKMSTNQSTITQAALNDRDPEVRKLALNMSTNQSTITQVALNDRCSEIRKLALEKSNGESTICRDTRNIVENKKSAVTYNGSNYSFFFSWKKEASNPHWTGIGFSYSDLDGLGNQADLSFSQSYSVVFNPVDVYTSLGSHWLLVGGVGIDWSRYHFKGNMGLKEEDGITKFIPDSEGRKYNSSKLLAYYFTFPLLLEYQLNKFFISGGAVAYLKCYSKSQIEYFENGKKQQIDLGRDLNILPVNARFMMQVGFDNLSIFAYYSPFSLFKEGKGPDIKPMGAGVKFGF